MKQTDTQTRREHYAYFKSISTRWIDNDVYGHINNAVYYSYFDTVCNSYLIDKGNFDLAHAPIIGFVVASECQYLAPIKFPAVIQAGMCVNRIGNSSVEYGVGIFQDEENNASAYGTFTHVFVNRQSGQSTRIPADIHSALTAILVATA